MPAAEEAGWSSILGLALLHEASDREAMATADNREIKLIFFIWFGILIYIVCAYGHGKRHHGPRDPGP